MLTKGPGALDPFCAFQSPDCDDAIENLIKARFVGGLRGQDTPANSVFNFMQNRHPRAARAWFPKDATPFRVALIERLMAKERTLDSVLWQGYCRQMADLVTINHLAEGTIFEVPEHISFEYIIPEFPAGSAEMAALLEDFYKPTHPIRQTLFASDCHYLVRKLQGKG